MTRFESGYLDALDFTAESELRNAQLSQAARDKVKTDCEAFQAAARAQLQISTASDEQAGHDFWLTRNRHGAGFWDRPEYYGGEANAAKLTDIAHGFGECDAYLNGDGTVDLG